jgi:hypothetical protein
LVFLDLSGRKSFLDASKEVCVGVNGENPKYMFMSLHQPTEQKYCVKGANNFFENVAGIS